MLSQEEERFILSKAYVPEHVVPLMTALSGGEPFLMDGFFCCGKDDWVILVGYPLDREFSESECDAHLDRIRERFGPSYVWVIAPRLPFSRIRSCDETERDHYYTLPADLPPPSRQIQRLLRKAAPELRVEQSREMGKAHEGLSREFIARADPPPRIRELLLKVKDYVVCSEHALVLNAWDKANRLSAFYVLDLSADLFSTYVIGCHSKKAYVPGASDLLCAEMIRVSEETGKRYIHLGLGVNEGIRRFKAKWGGQPTLSYEMCGLVFRKRLFLDFLRRALLPK